MASHRGYLLIADLSGYTAYLTTTEMAHANPVIMSLLEVLVARLGDPLHLWRMEGDAVLAYTTDKDFPSGDTFLSICEELYTAFAARRQNIQSNTSCPCRACAQVGDLDLKMLVHYGEFQEMQIGPMRDISGPDVILVHRLCKTGVKEATGIRSYAMMSGAAFEAMGKPQGLVEYSESFEHFGEVPLHVYDLAAAWHRLRDGRERVYIAEEDGILTTRIRLALSPAKVWEILVAPQSKTVWMGLKAVNLDADLGRPGMGAAYHCIHAEAEFHFKVVDWEPFRYFSNQFVVFADTSLRHDETYELTAVEGGTEIRYTTGPVYDPEDPERARHPEVDAVLVGFYGPGYDHWFPELQRNVVEDPGAYVRGG